MTGVEPLQDITQRHSPDKQNKKNRYKYFFHTILLLDIMFFY
jgi:hypothetical protein